MDNTIVRELLVAFWLFLPAGVANMSPVLAVKIPLLRSWKTPLDFGKSYNGKRILGPNKTWRGLLFGMFMGGLTGIFVLSWYTKLSFSVESVILAALFGGFIGFGALVGDALESFFKRQRGIKSGESWFPFDQIDYIIGGLVCMYLVMGIVPIRLTIFIFVLYFGLHLAVSYIGYKVGLKDKPI